MTVVDDVKSRLDIQEVISRYSPLSRSGRGYKANCPFHQERTPSFYVFPDRQTWRCFGACATGGDVFSFVMRVENLDFSETLKRLAQEVGVATSTRENSSEQQTSFEVNEAACRYFQDLLGSSPGVEARRYMENRGLDRGIIERFELGVSPQDGQSLAKHLSKVGYTPQQQASAGVVRTTDSGQIRDLFRGRLMIPIRDGQARLAGFGGRALDDSTPKYLNSPRGPVFDKGRLLYAYHLARSNAPRDGAVIVEGYMDAIAAYQHGFDNVVASMGTALTEHQVAEIRRLTNRVTMALDPDAAGRQATLRSLESSWRVFQTQVAGRAQGTTLFQRQDMPDLRIAVLPSGLDPDALIRQSTEEWSRTIEGAVPLLEYLFDALSAQVDSSTPQGKARLVEFLFPMIAAVSEPTVQDHYFQLLADQLGVTQETLRATVGRPSAAGPRRAARAANRTVTASPFARMDHDPLEEYCLTLLFKYPELQGSEEELRPEYFQRLENREVFNQWCKVAVEGDNEDSLLALRQRIEEHLQDHLGALLNKEIPPLDSRQRTPAFLDGVRRLEERYLRELKTEEEIRFGDAEADIPEETYQAALQVNQRIKTNQAKRGIKVGDL